MFNKVMAAGSAVAVFLFWKAGTTGGPGGDALQAAGWAVFVAAYPLALLLNAIFGKD